MANTAAQTAFIEAEVDRNMRNLEERLKAWVKDAEPEIVWYLGRMWGDSPLWDALDDVEGLGPVAEELMRAELSWTWKSKEVAKRRLSEGAKKEAEGALLADYVRDVWLLTERKELTPLQRNWALRAWQEIGSLREKAQAWRARDK